jgi:hypothetical protein
MRQGEGICLLGFGLAVWGEESGFRIRAADPEGFVPVAPAKAGAQFHRRHWAPAFAGATTLHSVKAC